MIHIFIPLSAKRDLHPRVWPSLVLQTVSVIVHKCRTPGEDDATKGKTQLAISGERSSRKLCQAEAAKIKPRSKYVIMQDSERSLNDSNNDYVTYEDSIQKAIDFLDTHSDFGAVSLAYQSAGHDKDDKNSHIHIGWVMYRYEVFAALNFEHDPTQGDICCHVTRQIRDMGFRFGYLDNVKRTMHC